MMKHSAIQEMVWRLQDAELSAADRASVQAHLADCGECLELARRAGLAHRLLASAPQPAPSEAFVGAVMGRLSSPEQVRQPVQWPQLVNPWRLVPRLGLSMAAAALTIAVLIRPQPAVATEALLRSDWPEQEGWAFSDTSPEADLLLGSISELP